MQKECVKFSPVASRRSLPDFPGEGYVSPAGATSISLTFISFPLERPRTLKPHTCAKFHIVTQTSGFRLFARGWKFESNKYNSPAVFLQEKTERKQFREAA